MAPSLILLTLLGAAALVAGQRNPEISFISSDIGADIGGTAELKCSVLFAGHFPVMWIKKDTPTDDGRLKDVLISTDAILLARESRFALRHDEDTSTYTLQISDIQEADQATYECRCQIDIQTSISSTVELSVRLPPVITDNSTRSVVAGEGERVELSCFATGFPPPEITWRRDNNALLPTGSAIYRGNVLVIHNIKKEDRGIYYCVATNGVTSTGSKRNVAVEVEFPPDITVPRPVMYQALQYDMDLECLVEAYPTPRITWLKDDLVLNNNQHYKMSTFTTTDQTTTSSLRVLSVERKQYGTYTCRASNRLGVAEAQVKLVESYSPVCPPACNASGAGRLLLSSAVMGAAMLAVIIKMAVAVRR